MYQMPDQQLYSFKGRLFQIVILIFLTQSASAQTTVVKDAAAVEGTTVVIPGKKYDRSGYHNFFWGKHYRKEWSTPIRVKNFYIDTAKGGLTPVKEAGSRQSMGLRLQDKNGKEYVLRSIDKDFGNGLPEIFHGTFISRIAKDQASIGYPLAAITITPMISATGIYHTNPEVVFLPEQPALGEYNTTYANQLYLFEERPDGNQEDAQHFGYSKKVIGTERLFEHLYEDNDYAVDQKAFAKARLFDMLIGDWGRHADQWRWAAFKEDGKTTYKPIPRDRDQAYVKFDGFYPFIATHVIGATRLESFDGDIDNVANFNYPAYPLDYRFLNKLTRQHWIDIAKDLQYALTDEVISNAIHQLPPELFAINGETIISQLKSRRDNLEKYAIAYYKFLAGKVMIMGTDKNELFEINRINDKEVQISVYKISKEKEIKEMVYSRIFMTGETKEVRLFGLKGDDMFKLTGPASSGVEIGILGVKKGDVVVNETGKRIPDQTEFHKGATEKFDSSFQSKVHISPILLVHPSDYRVFKNNSINLFTRPGLHLGLNFTYRVNPWKKDSLETTHRLCVNYGFLRKTFYSEYLGTIPELIGSWDLVFKARLDRPGAENFYGVGNDTKKVFVQSYYNTFSTRLFGGIGISRSIGKQQHAEATVFYQQVKVDSKADFENNNLKNYTYLFDSKKFAGIDAGYSIRKTDNDKYPNRGFDIDAGAGYIMELGQGNSSFFKVNSSASVYIPVARSLTLAIRAGGGHIIGDAEYYHLNNLGGNQNLRGYARERFHGKTSFYNNNELRWLVNTHNYFFNGKIGLIAFLDNGRIWQPGENSSLWHMGYGGGLAIIPFNKVAFTGTYGWSREGTDLSLKLGYFF
jgi:hypothetical protein